MTKKTRVNKIHIRNRPKCHIPLMKTRLKLRPQDKIMSLRKLSVRFCIRIIFLKLRCRLNLMWKEALIFNKTIYTDICSFSKCQVIRFPIAVCATPRWHVNSCIRSNPLTWEYLGKKSVVCKSTMIPNCRMWLTQQITGNIEPKSRNRWSKSMKSLTDFRYLMNMSILKPEIACNTERILLKLISEFHWRASTDNLYLQRS